MASPDIQLTTQPTLRAPLTEQWGFQCTECSPDLNNLGSSHALFKTSILVLGKLTLLVKSTVNEVLPEPPNEEKVHTHQTCSFSTLAKKFFLNRGYKLKELKKPAVIKDHSKSVQELALPLLSCSSWDAPDNLK